MDENKNKIENSFKIDLDDHGRLVVFYTSILDNDQDVIARTEMIKAKLLVYLKNQPDKKFKVIFDLSEIGSKIKHLPAKAKSTYLELSKHEQLKAAAIIGPRNIASIVFKLVLATIYSTWKIDYFYTKKNAIEWLDKIV